MVSPHTPVMLDEVVEVLAPRDGGSYVDATYGAGGYSRALLDSCACRVWGIDRDRTAIERGREMERRYAGRLTLIQGRYGDMAGLLGGMAVDGIAFDLGISSMQVDTAERGFSFRADGPLDMRMEGDGPSAADLVNRASETELADIIYRLGEERASRRIARAIVERRRETPFTRTAELADTVRRVVRAQPGGIDAATRTFQALRIHVNDELGELDRGLDAAERLLKTGGRMAVVSFHSLEDRRVKEFLRRRGGAQPRGSRHLPERTDPRAPSFRLIRRGALKPSAAEVAANPRARSARLRAAERTAAAAWSESASGANENLNGERA